MVELIIFAGVQDSPVIVRFPSPIPIEPVTVDLRPIARICILPREHGYSAPVGWFSTQRDDAFTVAYPTSYFLVRTLL